MNEIIAINVYMINEFSPGEQIGVKFPTALEMTVKSVSQTVSKKEVYPTIEERVAMIYINLIKKHCFYNANKRTAHVSMVTFLDINGKKWTMNEQKSEDLAVYVATYDGPFDTLKVEIVDSIKENTKDT